MQFKSYQSEMFKNVQHYANIIVIIADYYENLCFFTMVVCYGQNYHISSEFVDRTNFGSNIKNIGMLVLLGLQISSIFRRCITTPVLKLFNIKVKKGIVFS
jgi:hypothetical protein